MDKRTEVLIKELVARKDFYEKEALENKANVFISLVSSATALTLFEVLNAVKKAEKEGLNESE